MMVMSPKLGEVLVKTTHSKDITKRLKASGYKPIYSHIVSGEYPYLSENNTGTQLYSTRRYFKWKTLVSSASDGNWRLRIGI